MELNDYRAVYRSKLLLESDLAARSASLSSIYSDLGFQQLALEEAAKSVNTDPANYSAHRFLSDSYSALPRHEIARVSELLQSQLLQPINITPVRPEAAESQLFILEGTGPSDLSFNEFNPLFNRNRLALQASGVVGGDSTWGDEVVASGVYNNFSMSAGQFHYETNGFRPNDYQKQNIYDVLAQYSLSYETSVQAEFRAKKVDKGDLTLNFFPDDFLPSQRNKEDTKTGRFGFRHSFAPGSDLIGSLSYQHQDASLVDTSFPLSLGSEVNGYGVELQHLLRFEHLKLISGIGYFKTKEEDTLETVIPLPPPALPISSTQVTKRDIRHTNLYLYSYIDYFRNVTLTVGGSGDFFKGGIVDKDQFNPKAGITWNPLTGTTLRAAAFRTLTRTLISDQTLEPTQVAGFTQFFDDTEGTQAWVYGAGIDQKFSKNMYGGLEYYKRDLKVPFNFRTVPPPPEMPISEIRRADWREHEGRAYLYWTPHPWLALRAEYQYEKFDRDPEFIAGIKDVKTYRFPLEIGFFHPSGFSLSAKATYINQKGDFLPNNTFVPDPSNPPTIAGSDSFWIVDARISYRLPKRLGIVSLTAKNLFDKTFKYQDTDFVNPSIQPKRSVFLKITLAM
jgi:outer membrane receptor protein involved in Fe transport